MEQFSKFSTQRKIAAALLLCATAILSGLIISAYIIGYGKNIQVAIPRDLFIWLDILTDDDLTKKEAKWLKIAGIGFFIPSLLFIAGILKAKPKLDLHGKARFANEKDIVNAGLRSDHGLIAGFTGKLPTSNYGIADKKGKIKLAPKGHLTSKNMLIYGGPEHMFLYAPTRSGKGVGVVVPNLLNWPDSTVVLDIKKENWQLTSGFRKQNGQEVFLFDPLDEQGRTHQWNPLSIVRRNTHFQIEDLQRIATLFIPEKSRDPFFDKAAQAAFVGIGGYLAETPELPFTLGEIYRQLTTGTNVVKRFKDIIRKRQESGNPLSLQTEYALNDFISKSENTFESVKSTITANLNLYANPLLDKATSKSDFNFADLRKKRISIYVGITPNNLVRLAPLLNLFFQSVVDANMQELPENNSDLKYKILLCMDEFTSVGELPVFKTGIGYFAGYGIKVLTIVQTPAQLRDIYGADAAEAYIDNAGVEIIFTPKSIKTAKEVSERLGTLGMDSQSTSKSKHLFNRKNSTISTSEQKRDLLMPQELIAMDQSEAIVLIAGHPPVKAKKLKYYAEKVFLERAQIAPPTIASIMADGSPDALRGEVAGIRQANITLTNKVESLETQLANISALKALHDENIANGQPAEIEMTNEEIANPDLISVERLKLSKSKARDKIMELKEQNRLTSKEAAAELVTAIEDRN